MFLCLSQLDDAARRQYPRQFFQRSFRVLDTTQGIALPDNKVPGIRFQILEIVQRGVKQFPRARGIQPLNILPGLFEHVVGNVQKVGLITTLDELQPPAAGAAAHIQATTRLVRGEEFF